MDVLKEQWESAEKSDESVVSYALKVRSRVSEMVEVVKQNLMEGQRKQKEWYDKDARLREFEVGDTVLVHQQVNSLLGGKDRIRLLNVSFS